MGKGDGGLSIDSDPFRLFFHHRLTLHAPPLHMDHAFQFPVNLNSGDTDAPPPPPADDSGKAKPEMDFFAISRSKALNHHREGGLSLVGDDPSKTSDNDVNTGLNLLMMNTTAVEENGLSSKPEENPKTEVAELQAELEQLAGENQRLRNMLTQATSDYNSLQMQLIAVMEDRKCDNNPDPETNRFDEKKEKLPVVPRQFMDLGLAEPTFDVQNMEENSRSSSDGGRASLDRTEANNELEAVSRGSDPESRNAQCKEPGRRTSSRLRERSPDQELSIWNSKLPRFNSPPPKSSVEQAATEATMRKARVSVRARSESNMISDGCQWRKYGQKMAKGNPCPRAYYRCTMTGNCPVRKQVQRCAEDRTILVTTYEGNHNHPLPPAAMAMASTTSSAARMLLSGSMSSTDSLMNANFLARTLLPCSSTMATISASAPFPTVTLDLTQNPNSNSLLQTPSNQLQVPFMNPNQSFQNPSAALLPIFRQALFNQTKFSGLQTSQDLKGGSSENQTQGSDNLTAATAAIAADPNFTAALAAAISSIMGGGSQPNGGSSSAPASAANGSGKISNSTN